VIFAKTSDIFSRKSLLLLGLILFTTFSIACGVAQTMTQLIIFRAFQGIGGSGIYSMVSVIASEMVPLEKLGTYMAIFSSVFVVSSVLGPILGGVINDHSSWRWVFLLNAPAGAMAIALVMWVLPSEYPYVKTKEGRGWRNLFEGERWKRLDWVGTTLSLAGSILLCFALEEAGTVYAWGSAVIIVTLVISGVCWVAFVFWERVIEKNGNSKQEAILPWRLVSHRISGGVLL
jgi:MFS family permease